MGKYPKRGRKGKEGMKMESVDNCCTVKSIRELKSGEFFKLNENSQRVYIRDEYNRSERKYCCIAFDDINACRMFNGEKLVFVGFTF